MSSHNNQRRFGSLTYFMPSLYTEEEAKVLGMIIREALLYPEREKGIYQFDLSHLVMDHETFYSLTKKLSNSVLQWHDGGGRSDEGYRVKLGHTPLAFSVETFLDTRRVVLKLSSAFLEHLYQVGEPLLSLITVGSVTWNIE